MFPHILVSVSIFENFISLQFIIHSPFVYPDLNRYAYSGEANEDFDKDDTNLTLVKPSPTPSKDFRTAPETRTVQGSNGASSNGDLEEDKIE